MKSIIWDLDGTLYPQNEKYFNLFFDNFVKTTAERENIRSEELWSKVECIKTFANLKDTLAKFNANKSEIEKNLQNAEVVSKLEPDNRLLECFKEAMVGNIIYSHSNKSWIINVLKQLKLDCFFKRENIFSADDLGSFKFENEKGFELIIKTVNINPCDCFMVDDQARNLLIPEKMGITPVLIQGQNMFPQEAPDGFNCKMYKTPSEFLRNNMSKFS